VDFIIHKVVQLEEIHITDCYLVVKWLSCPSVVKDCLPAISQTCHLEKILDLIFFGAIKDRNSYANSFSHSICKGNNLFFAQFIDKAFQFATVKYLFQIGFNCIRSTACSIIAVYQVADSLSKLFCCPAKMCFQNLAGIHSRWNSKRIQHNIDRCTIFHEGHIFFWEYYRHNSFVPVAARYLVAYRNLSFHGNIDLDCLYDSRRKFIPFLYFVDLIFVIEFDDLNLVFFAIQDF